MTTPGTLLFYALSLDIKLFHNLTLSLVLFVLATIISLLTGLIHVLIHLANVRVLEQLG